ncbi:MAG: hypothetical protein K9G61_00275 [Bacteroidales bacterium]|jgi:hypothetical protein|nr:hypothetical protein [Bacteroidales bacterium]
MEKITPGIGSRVSHPDFGKGVVIQVYSDSFEITFMDFGVKTVSKSYTNLQVIDHHGDDTDLISYEKVERVFRKMLLSLTDIQHPVYIADKWKGGKLILKPGNDSLKEKEMPIDAFFHKIVMVRDRIRVMEQRINASELTDDEKVALQQYITRIYGSLTSFNVLFADKDDYFVGEKST